MLFSSPVFLFSFLPLVLALYYLRPQEGWRNGVLLLASLVFYFFGEGLASGVLVFTWLFTWSLGLWMGKSSEPRKKWLLALGLAVLLGMLAYFKYWRFLGGQAAPHLPLGISFFVFQALSYLFDLQSGLVLPEPKLARFALYKSFFPQLISGPIVRYAEIKGQLGARPMGLEAFSSAARRFSFGLAKKVLIADSMAGLADPLWRLSSRELSAPLAWLALGSYAIQIYFDFSGYTDMACGLAGLFGFSFPENFNYPYCASSISDFWKRWHMTLSRWFRDYVYIPLGGKRRGSLRTMLNLWAVFLLCGLWHGAAWNFLAWGACFGFFLSLEHFFKGAFLRLPAWAGWIYAQAVVLGAWALFRAANLGQARALLGQLFSGPGAMAMPLAAYLQPENFVVAGLAIPLALGAWPALGRRLGSRGAGIFAGLEWLFAGLWLFLAAARAASGAYQAFLYFRF